MTISEDLARLADDVEDSTAVGVSLQLRSLAARVVGLEHRFLQAQGQVPQSDPYGTATPPPTPGPVNPGVPSKQGAPRPEPQDFSFEHHNYDLLDSPQRPPCPYWTGAEGYVDAEPCTMLAEHDLPHRTPSGLTFRHGVLRKPVDTREIFLKEVKPGESTGEPVELRIEKALLLENGTGTWIRLVRKHDTFFVAIDDGMTDVAGQFSHEQLYKAAEWIREWEDDGQETAFSQLSPEQQQSMAEEMLETFTGFREEPICGLQNPFNTEELDTCKMPHGHDDNGWHRDGRKVWHQDGPGHEGGYPEMPAGMMDWVMKTDDRSNIEDLIEASSLGTPEARAARESVSPEHAREVVQRSKELTMLGLQRRAVVWHMERFPDAEAYEVLMKTMEELGEVAGEMNADIGRNTAKERGDGVAKESADVVVCLLVLLGRYYPTSDLLAETDLKLAKLETPGAHRASTLTETAVVSMPTLTAGENIAAGDQVTVSPMTGLLVRKEF